MYQNRVHLIGYLGKNPEHKSRQDDGPQIRGSFARNSAVLEGC